MEVVGREFPQILLIHANQLNADQMPELLQEVGLDQKLNAQVPLDLAPEPAWRLDTFLPGDNAAWPEVQVDLRPDHCELVAGGAVGVESLHRRRGGLRPASPRAFGWR